MTIGLVLPRTVMHSHFVYRAGGAIERRLFLNNGMDGDWPPRCTFGMCIVVVEGREGYFVR